MMRRRTVPPIAALALSLAVVALPTAAEAHRLKLFVTVEDGEIGGYAFFIGGGRPEGVDFFVEDAHGAGVFHGKTDDHGGFRFRPQTAADYRVVVDTGDGHRAEGTVAADRLAEVAPAAATTGATAVAPTAGAADPTTVTAAAPASAPAPACAAPIDPARLGGEIQRAVDVSLARQLRPLLEAYDQAEGRLRFNDVMGGIGMIVGLAGAAAWAMARRRDRRDAETKP